MAGSRKHSIGLRAKIIVIFSLLFAALLLLVKAASFFGVPYTSYEGTLAARRADAFKNLSRIADMKKDSVLHYLNDQRDNIRLFAGNSLLRDKSPGLLAWVARSGVKDAASVRSEIKSLASYGVIEAYLHEIVNSYRTYKTARIIDEKTGLILVSTESSEVGRQAVRHTDGETPEGLHYVGEPLSLDSYIEEVGLSKDGFPLFQVDRSFKDKTGRSGVLTLTLNTESVVNSLVRIGKTPDIEDETVIITENFIQMDISISETSVAAAKCPPDCNLMATEELAIGGDEGIMETEDDRGRPVIAAYRHISVNTDSSWGLIVMCNKRKFFSVLRQDVIYSSLIGLFGIAAALGLTVLAARRLTGSLRSLRDAAARVAEGDLSAQSEVNSSDEVGELAEAFNYMVEHIGERQRALTLAKEKLEEEITERKQAEQMATESSREMETLFNNVPIGIVYLDSNLKVLTVNKFMCALVGLAPEDMVGRPCFDSYGEFAQDPLRKGGDRICSFCRKDECFRLKKSTVLERPLGGRLIRVTTVPEIGKEGGIVRFVELIEEITEQKKAEEQRRVLQEQLHQAQKMQAIGQLAGGIAHDFNNRLAAIVGIGYVLRNRLEKDDPLHAYVDQIFTSSEKAATLIKSLLAFSRKQIIDPRPASLNGIVRGMEGFLRSVIGEHVEFRTELDGVEPVVMADSGQIEHVLINLAINSRDAMPEGGKLTVITGLAQPGTEQLRTAAKEATGRFAFLSVRDTGAGMDEATRQRIFEPFFTTKKFGKGTGLGLSMVYGIVSQHGGLIDVRSSPGLGTAVTVYLPEAALEPAEEVVRPAPGVRPAGGTETVLIVEDEADIRRAFRIILESCGYTVIEAQDGDEGLVKFKEHSAEVSLIVLDVILPRKNGPQLYDEIKRLNSAIKAVFISGYAADVAGVSELGESGIGFLLKPVFPEDLLHMIRRMLDAEGPQAP